MRTKVKERKSEVGVRNLDPLALLFKPFKTGMF
jgi:hypothetical protein